MKAKRVLLECRLTRERERLGLSTFGQYLDMIESEQNTTARTQFINLVTTHYTYFMRESSQFSFIRDTVLPELLARRSHRPWRFLCAGCSTGDECYSLSMIVEDFAKLHPLPDVTITGVDISESVLAEARIGRYPESHIERAPRHWRMGYFKPDGYGYVVRDQIRNRVRFYRANLTEPEALRRTYDLILCRNTIIYFEDAVKQRFITTLHQHLIDEGYLILGHAEIVRDRTRFAYQGDSIYRKLKHTGAIHQ